MLAAPAVVVSCIVMKGRRSDHCGGYELPKPGFWEWGFYLRMYPEREGGMGTCLQQSNKNIFGIKLKVDIYLQA